jgi:hypothetical protein
MTACAESGVLKQFLGLWRLGYGNSLAFPDLFSISRCKEALAANLLHFSKNALQWSIIFIRYVHDWWC